MDSTTDKLNRRTILKGAVAGAITLSAPAVVRAQSRKLVYSTWGGSWEAALRKAWFDPFTAATGIEVVTATGNTYGKIRAMVEAGNVEWDVVEVDRISSTWQRMESSSRSWISRSSTRRGS